MSRRVALCLALLALSFALAALGGRPAWALYAIFLALVPVSVAVAIKADLDAFRRKGVIATMLMACALLVAVTARPMLHAYGYTHAVLGALTLLVTLGLVRRRLDTAVTLVAWVAVFGLVEAVVGLAQSFGVLGLVDPSLHPVVDASGSFSNRNHLAGFLNMALALTLGSTFAVGAPRDRDRPRAETAARLWLAGVAASLMGLAILASRSRGGTITLVLVLLAFAALLTLRRRRQGHGVPGSVVWLILLAVFGVGAALGLSSLVQRFSRIEFNNRPQLYEDTLKLIVDHPFLGVGPGMYRWEFRPYQTSKLELWFTHAHNDYLEVAAEWGIPIALMFWGFVGWRLYRTVVIFLRSRDRRTGGLALGCAGAMLAISIHSLVDFNLHIPANLIVFSMVLGIGWSLEDRSSRAPSSATSSPTWTVGARWLFVMVLLAAAWSVAGRLRSERLLASSVTVSDLEAAVSVAPEAPEPHFRLAKAYRDQPGVQDLEMSRSHLMRAVSLNPWSWRYWWELAQLEEVAGRAVDAERALLHAIELNPRSGVYRWRLANFYLREGDLLQMREQVRNALAVDRDLETPAWRLLDKVGLPWLAISEVWPRDPASRLNLLRFAAVPAGRFSTEPLLEEWRRLFDDSDAEGANPVELEKGLFFVDYLRKVGHTQSARAEWRRLLAANGIVDTAYDQQTNLVWNGGFELRPVGGAFGWRLPERDAIDAGVESSAEGAGSKVLAVRFERGAIGGGVVLRQPVVVTGGRRYQLRVRAQVEEFGGTARLELRGSGGAGPLAIIEFDRTTDAWRRYVSFVSVPDDVEELSLNVQVNARGGLDNLSTGKFCLDDITLKPADSQPRAD